MPEKAVEYPVAYSSNTDGKKIWKSRIRKLC